MVRLDWDHTNRREHMDARYEIRLVETYNRTVYATDAHGERIRFVSEPQNACDGQGPSEMVSEYVEGDPAGHLEFRPIPTVYERLEMEYTDEE